MYLGPTDFYLSCLDTFAYLDLRVLSVVMQEVYGKQRSENTMQAKAVTACATLPYTGNPLGAGEDLCLLGITALCCLWILIFAFKIKPHIAAADDAY